MTQVSCANLFGCVSQISIESLEYGKLRISENGPIEPYAEHGVLGHSPGFPLVLREFCTPRLLGLGEASEQSSMLAQVGHGTVLRPVIIQDRHYTLCYRIESQPEGGDEQPHTRRFISAHYRVDVTGELSPAKIVQRIGDTRGVTRAMVEGIQPFTVTTSAPEELVNIADDTFLNDALIYVLSSIGIHIETTEDHFFQLADKLWRALPGSIRGLFSAGWNVGHSLSGALVVSYSADPARGCPRYDPSRSTWLVPPALTSSCLFPGRMFVFACTGKGPMPEAYDVKSEVPGALPALPDFRDAATRSTVRLEGLARRDDHLRALIARWLRDAAEPDLAGAELMTCVTTLLASPLRASFLFWCAEAIDAGTGDPRRRVGLIWAIVAGEPGTDLPLSTDLGRSAVAWISALIKGDAGAALPAFLVATVSDELLEEQAALCWERLLDASLTVARCAECHQSLIRLRREGRYANWVARNAFELAIALFDQDVLDALSKTYGLRADAADALGRLQRMKAPTGDNVSWLSGLSGENQQRIGKLLQRLWASPSPVLLEWAAGLPPTSFDDGLLKIAAGGDIEVEGVEACVEQASALALGNPFTVRLSGEVLRHVDRLRSSIEQQPSAWDHVLELWPAEAKLTVIDPQPIQDVGPGVIWAPTRSQLHERMEFWFSGETRRSSSDSARARALLRAAARVARDPRVALSAVDICGALARKELIDGALANDNQAILAAAVLKAADEHLPSSFAAQLWRGSLQGWQIRLLLEAFGFLEEFAPTSAQLSALIAHRRWLREKLALGVLPEIRRKFELASNEFHAVNYETETWFWGYTETPLWAAFRALPEDCRGELSQALTAYASSAQEKAKCCLLHLDLYRDQTAYREVLKAFVVPVTEASFGIGHEEAMDLLLSMAGKSSGLFQKRREVEFDPVSRLDGVLMDKCDNGRRLRVDAELFPLMWRVLRDSRLSSTIAELKEYLSYGR